MNAANNILAFDLATKTGYAFGCRGDASPRSGSIQLKKPGENRGLAFAALTRFLLVEIDGIRPALIAKEAPFRLQAFLERSNSEDSVRYQIGLHAVVEGVASSHNVPVVDIPAAKIRKHFIGKSSAGDSRSTKIAVIQRCKLLGYVPNDCMDDNRADACAVWDYAAAVYGKRVSSKLMMFGDGITT